MSEASDQPVAEEELVSTEAQGVADEANAQGDDQQLDDDGNPIEGQAEDDSEEIDVDGVKARVPKALKDAFLRQADYTRKTQEVAETRRALDARHAEIAQQAEAQNATLEKRVQVGLMDKQLEAYQSLDWNAYEREYGAGQVAQAMATWRGLEAERNGLVQDITQTEQTYRLSSERAVATALQEAEKVLATEVEGFGPELVRSVADVAGKYGFTARELQEAFVSADGIPDTRAFRVLARLASVEKELAAEKAKNTKAQTAEKQAQVQPAKTVGQKAGQYKPGLDDSLPIDEWNRRRQAQLAKAR